MNPDQRLICEYDYWRNEFIKRYGSDDLICMVDDNCYRRFSIGLESNSIWISLNLSPSE